MPKMDMERLWLQMLFSERDFCLVSRVPSLFPFFFPFKFAPALPALKTKGRSHNKALKRCIIEEAPLLLRLNWFLFRYFRAKSLNVCASSTQR